MAAALSGIFAAGGGALAGRGALLNAGLPPGGFPPIPLQPGIHQGFAAGAGVPLGRGGSMGMPGQASGVAPGPPAGQARGRGQGRGRGNPVHPGAGAPALVTPVPVGGFGIAPGMAFG